MTSGVSVRRRYDLLYCQPILAFWRSRGGRLQDIICHVLVHEIGHHFGLSDDDMERIEGGVLKR
jgi:predicted Zn-dependent protease with MMP-like domain